MAITAQDSYQNSDGRLQLVWIDGGQARTKWEIDAAGNYSGDVDLGPHGYAMNTAAPISISRNQQGRLVVVAWSIYNVRVAISQLTQNGVWHPSWTILA